MGLWIQWAKITLQSQRGKARIEPTRSPQGPLTTGQPSIDPQPVLQIPKSHSTPPLLTQSTPPAILQNSPSIPNSFTTLDTAAPTSHQPRELLLRYHSQNVIPDVDALIRENLKATEEHNPMEDVEGDINQGIDVCSCFIFTDHRKLRMSSWSHLNRLALTFL
jgi:hypothetical protein